ncbi:MAG: hypothetical protein WA941_13840 [Nitrososphaeraceae archaeon]
MNLLFNGDTISYCPGSKDLHLPPSPPLGLQGFADATPMEFGTSTVAKMNLLFA